MLQPAQRICAYSDRLFYDVYGRLSVFDFGSLEGRVLLEPAPMTEQETHVRLTNRHAMELAANDKYCVSCADDKRLRVLDVTTGKVLTQRELVKRPACIDIHGSTLVVGDRFGDVYDYDLTQVSLETALGEEVTKVASEEDDDEEGVNPPLLGHVSIMGAVKLVHSTADPKRRYIISADRDEHIRVSRYPQSFVIEQFLLGHEAFVSALVVPSARRDLLISFGGDEHAFLWSWEQGREVARLSLERLVQETRGVAAYFGVTTVLELPSGGDSTTRLVVACRDVAKVFILSLSGDFMSIDSVEVVALAAPALDLAIVKDRLVVALDTRSQREAASSSFQLFAIGAAADSAAMATDVTGEAAGVALNAAARVEVAEHLALPGSRLDLLRKKTQEEIDESRERKQEYLARKKEEKAAQAGAQDKTNANKRSADAGSEGVNGTAAKKTKSAAANGTPATAVSAAGAAIEPTA